MPTLQDVAKKAGVSIATVSKVLSNTPYFTDETRDKVMVAVRELGYMPNLAARALSSGKTHIIAVVFPYIYDAIFKDPLVMQILEGIEGECSAVGYNLLLSTPRLTHEGPDDNYKKLIQSGYIDGLIAIDSIPLASVAETARERAIPTVVIGYAQSQYSVHGDDFHGAQQLVEHLVGLGHREIGIISVPENMNTAVNQRMNGVRHALQAQGIAFTADRVALSDFSTNGGAQASVTLLNRFPELTAFICLNDRTAIGAIQQLQSMGKRVPEDISVVGYDDIAMSAVFTPHLTTINQKASVLGQMATKMLFDILTGKTPKSIVLPIELKIRESTAKAKN